MTAEESAAQSRVNRTKVNKMKSFTEALKDKYCDVGDIDNNISIVIFAKPSSPKKRGDSDSNEADAELAHLKTVVLNNMDIGHAGMPQNGLKSLCPNIVDLDLQGNCLNSWTETLTILSHLPRLKFVNLSSNKIDRNKESLGIWNKPIQSLEDMVLNRTGITWEEVVSLVRITPKLKELHICENAYETIQDENLHVLEGIETLRLNNNNIRDWSEFWKLRHLPELQNLVLSGNPVEGVFFDQSGMRDLVLAQTLNSSAPEEPVAMCAAILDEVVSNMQDSPEQCSQDGDKSGKTDSSPRETFCDVTNTMSENGIDEPQHIAAQILEGVLDGVSQMPNSLEEDVPVDQDAPQSEFCDKSKACDSGQIIGNPGDTALLITVLNSGKCAQESFALKTQNENSNNSEAMETNSSENKFLVPNSCDDMDKDPTSLKYNPADSGNGADTDSNNATPQPFQNLSMLCLSQTKLSDWKHLCAINSFPKLKALRIADISLGEDLSQDDRRKLFLACLPSISVLNGGEISQPEREKAERHFLRHFNEKEIKPERYVDLVQKHGVLQPVADVDISRGFQEWVTVKFVHNGSEVLEDKIRLMDNVGKLKTFIRQNLCKRLGIVRFKIWHLACGPFHSDPEVELADLFLDSLPLSRFDIQEGDEIHIEKLQGFAPRWRPASSLIKNVQTTSQRDGS